MTPVLDAKAHPKLHTVKVGDRVWLTVSRSSAHSERYLSEISHVGPTGRLYICADAASYARKGGRMFDDWRYGFDPKTGKAHHYQFHTMSYATPEEIATECGRIEAEEAKKNAEEKERKRLHLIREAAPEMAEILLSAYVHVSHGGPTRGQVEDVLKKAGVL